MADNSRGLYLIEWDEQGGDVRGAADRAVPDRYGCCNVGENIGEGTFGKVKLGVHVHTGQRVAVKTLQK